MPSEKEYWIEEEPSRRGDDFTFFRADEEIPLKKGDRFVIIPGPLGRGWKLRVVSSSD